MNVPQVAQVALTLRASVAELEAVGLPPAKDNISSSSQDAAFNTQKRNEL